MDYGDYGYDYPSDSEFENDNKFDGFDGIIIDKFILKYYEK